jgi:transcriptional regulator with GAF, ATPase, and Fis domain
MSELANDPEDSRPEARRAESSVGGAITPGVARDLSELARDLQAASDSTSVMRSIVHAAVAEIHGASGAAITLLHHRKVTSPAHSDETARRVGTAESDTGEGPCVDTSRREVTLRSNDLRGETRWPKWAAVAVENGVLSVMSFQLFVQDDRMGALNVFADTADVFDDDAENTGLLLASHAAVAMAGTRNAEHLRLAVDTRDLIGQAKGILMERYKIRSDEAFNLLVVASQHSNRKLRDVAEHLAERGELPTRPRGRD